MRVYKCDRCGKHIKWMDRYALDVQEYLVDDSQPVLYEKRYLCTKCKCAFDEWFDDPKAKKEGE